MSECVVRMERVPKNCDDGCWGSLSGECPWCDSIDGYKMVGNRPLNCPIIAVLPDGHGRLVDAEQLRQVLVVYKETDALGHTPLQLCDAMPTIIPATERSEA